MEVHAARLVSLETALQSGSHPLYPEVTDGRGVAYERTGEWDKAEKDLLASLEVNPNQAYVINYLAYSWIEQGIKINKSLEMLKKANKLKSNDPYIIDSLGWALFKLKRYVESKEYLQIAVKLMPADPALVSPVIDTRTESIFDDDSPNRFCETSRIGW